MDSVNNLKTEIVNFLCSLGFLKHFIPIYKNYLLTSIYKKKSRTQCRKEFNTHMRSCIVFQIINKEILL